MTDEKHNGTTGGALDIKPEHVLPADLTDADLRGGDADGNLEPDAPDSVDGTTEAVRQRTDTFTSKVDLEDADIRNSAPGTREQD